MKNTKKYIRCHLVEATPMTFGAYIKKCKLATAANKDPKEKGYIIKYPDGYVSWCPKAQFERQGFVLEDGTKITENDILNFKRMGYQSCTTEHAPDGKPFTMIQMVFPTGFTSFATATCVDPKNYNEHIGCGICESDINAKLWNNLGFMLQWAKEGINPNKGVEIAKGEDKKRK